MRSRRDRGGIEARSERELSEIGARSEQDRTRRASSGGLLSRDAVHDTAWRAQRLFDVPPNPQQPVSYFGRCVPTCWPHLLVPLRGGRDAAAAAGDATAEAGFAEELELVLRVLSPKCTDVALA